MKCFFFTKKKESDNTRFREKLFFMSKSSEIGGNDVEIRITKGKKEDNAKSCSILYYYYLFF